ncbi:hypothetical protein [Chitinophaga agri]|uniref:Uncharacterized protein n=1 Tax=Chitinophaga agri TaxID=2703787 RepID=A0A6B9ZQJ1_9BACT|nr:hypothetical protein [Chitinophaga agri]QHS63253.1 hypothetical protein GWR21_27810 [Chitinophaga agri]
MKITVLNAVLVGNWNYKVFNAKWVETNLFSYKGNQPINGLVNLDDMEFGYEYDDLVLIVKTAAIELRLKDPNNLDNIERIAEVSNKIQSLLSHTPIKGIGFNIKYLLDGNDDSDFIKIMKTKGFALSDLELSQIRLSKKSEVHSTNITFEYLNGAIKSIAFNFHYPKPIIFDNTVIANHLKFAELKLRS